MNMIEEDSDFVFHRRKRLARIAGAILLTTIPLATYGEFAVREKILNMSDPDNNNSIDTAADHIRSMEIEFRIAFLCDILMILIELPMISIFHELLKHASPVLSFAAVYLRILMLFTACIAALFHFGSLFVATTTPYNDLALAILKARSIPASVSLIALSCHCIVLGILMIKSHSFPTLLGVGQLVSALGFFINGLCPLMFPQSTELAKSAVVLTSLPGDPTLCVYMLLKGIKRSSLTGKAKKL